MATFNLELNSRAGKEWSVRITHNRKSKKIKLDFTIPAEHFNKQAKFGFWIRKANIKHVKYNRDIQIAIDELRAKYELLEQQNVPALANIKKEALEGATLKTYFANYLKHLEADSAISYYKQQESKLNRFKDYFGENTPMSSITPQNIAEFKNSLLVRNLAGTTVNNIIDKIYTVFKAALADDTLDKDPFRAHVRAKTLKSNKVKLTDEHIEKLQKLSLKNWMHHTRNYYLFSYSNAGIRVVDLIQLRQGNVKAGRLEYEMDKTGHKKSIKLNSSALSILKEYHDPEADANNYLFPILENDADYAAFVTHAEKRKMERALRIDLHNHLSGKTSQINNNLRDISEIYPSCLNLIKTSLFTRPDTHLPTRPEGQ
ncbi:phage integrase SAM-like domain-containing protein [Dyadobacter sp. CY312]|uniref:tyrosine-type recombinase/integrase n=1 Tax=Dyadobacter sp. CY312 TaxID=2907303 RepID=UPI001F40B381|nr:phage integrase SAM-like domain-containing protein [Dyadobacter sp. CY312]MCE7044545.1 site-specific integrase [Dyadobacter sp. CY312]